MEIASRVVEREAEAVFFIVDALDKHPEDPDIQTLLPFATCETSHRRRISRRPTSSSARHYLRSLVKPASISNTVHSGETGAEDHQRIWRRERDSTPQIGP